MLHVLAGPVISPPYPSGNFMMQYGGRATAGSYEVMTRLYCNSDTFFCILGSGKIDQRLGVFLLQHGNRGRGNGTDGESTWLNERKGIERMGDNESLDNEFDSDKLTSGEHCRVG